MVQEKTGWHAVYEEIKKTVAVVQVMKTVFVPNEKGKIIASEYVISQVLSIEGKRALWV